MFCRFCCATLPADSAFCHSCGESLATTVTGASTRVAADPGQVPMPLLPLPRQTRRKKLAIWIGLTAGIVLGIVVVAGASGTFLWLMIWVRSSKDRGESSGSQIVPIREPQVMSLLDTAFTLNAAQGMNWNFNVPANATNVRVEGTFTASGDSGNDVEVYVLNDDEFMNWRNGQSVNPLYKSGRRPRGTLHAALPAGAGTYHLVFDNKFSPFTSKAVTASVRLRYTL